MPSRYIINLNLANSVHIVLACSASGPHIVQKVCARLLVENQVHIASIRDSTQLRLHPWPSFTGYTSHALLKISQFVVAAWVSFGWTQIAAMLLVVGKRHHYISMGDSIQYALLLFLDSGSLQRVIHIQSLLSFLSYAVAMISVQLFFQYYPGGLEYGPAKPSYALGRGLTYGLEIYDTRDSSGNYNKQSQLIFMQLVIKHTIGWLACVLRMVLCEEQQKQALDLQNMINGVSCNSAAASGCYQGDRVSSPIFLGYLFDAQSMTLDVCRKLLLLDMGFLTIKNAVQFGANCLNLTTSKDRPYQLIKAQELHGVVYGKMQLPWSCYELFQDHSTGNAKHVEVPDPFAKKNELMLQLKAANIIPADLQLPWDPGGFHLLHRLGDKPNFKKGGMSVAQHTQLIQAQGGRGPYRPKATGVVYKKDGNNSEGDHPITENYYRAVRLSRVLVGPEKEELVSSASRRRSERRCRL